MTRRWGGINCCDWNAAWHLPLVIDTMAYRFTKDPRMLDAAHKVTDYYLARLPEDSVPNWDFPMTVSL
jgi:unsaturated chondroitin disaccharide hydrolase